MKIIRMIKTMAGPAGVFTSGQMYTVDDTTAEQAVDAHAAEVVATIAETPSQETAAVAPAPEAAVMASPRKKVKN